MAKQNFQINKDGAIVTSCASKEWEALKKEGFRNLLAGGGGGGSDLHPGVCPKQNIYFSMDCMVIVYSKIQYLIVQVFSCSVDNDKEWLIIRTWSWNYSDLIELWMRSFIYRNYFGNILSTNFNTYIYSLNWTNDNDEEKSSAKNQYYFTFWIYD